MPEEDEANRLTVPYLRAWRIHFVLSQRELAKQAGITPGTVIRLERGERANYLTIRKLAQGLGIPMQQLLSENPAEKDLRGVA
ncbi:MAG TPA: helix-turn-helix transcriptional regulator [Ktedonobacterales bacterium]|nr:helix-turn-helix transcriptional regulator [Ktedonobacterales bacterium]